MNEIITERSGSILRVELNRPSKRNAMTSFLEKRPPDFTKTMKSATAA